MKNLISNLIFRKRWHAKLPWFAPAQPSERRPKKLRCSGVPHPESDLESPATTAAAAAADAHPARPRGARNGRSEKRCEKLGGKLIVTKQDIIMFIQFFSLRFSFLAPERFSPRFVTDGFHYVFHIIFHACRSTMLTQSGCARRNHCAAARALRTTAARADTEITTTRYDL